VAVRWEVEDWDGACLYRVPSTYAPGRCLESLHGHGAVHVGARAMEWLSTTSTPSPGSTAGLFGLHNRRQCSSSAGFDHPFLGRYRPWDPLWRPTACSRR
jgi:hypothetical protein